MCYRVIDNNKRRRREESKKEKLSGTYKFPDLRGRTTFSQFRNNTEKKNDDTTPDVMV
jgi:hypothetical protein